MSLKGSNATLTPKQEKFVQNLFKGLSQREAYKCSFECSKWNDKSIDVKACELANTDKIRLRLKELTDKLAERNIVTVEKLIAEYAKIGFSDIKDYISFDMEDVPMGVDNEGNVITESKQVIRVKPSREVDGTLISEVSISAKGVFSFKMHDKLNALEKMGKHLGMFTDKVEHSGTLGVQIIDDIE